MSKVLIKGGRVITATDDYFADVLVDGERVALIGKELDVDADQVIDAKGKYLFPGGIDPHTHFDMPFGGTMSADDFATGPRAAKSSESQLTCMHARAGGARARPRGYDTCT